MSKVHLVQKGTRRAVCGVVNPPRTAIGPEAVTCLTCRANSGFAFYEAGWNARDRQGD